MIILSILSIGYFHNNPTRINGYGNDNEDRLRLLETML